MGAEVVQMTILASIHMVRLACCLQVVLVDVVTSAVAAHVVSLAMAVAVEVEVVAPMEPPEVGMRAAEAMVDAAPTSM